MTVAVEVVAVEVMVLEEEFLLGSDPIGNVKLRSSETESSHSTLSRQPRMQQAH
jgi:hypothetical protein